MCGNPNAIYLFPVLLGLLFLGVFVHAVVSTRLYVGETDETFVSYSDFPKSFVLLAASYLWLAILLIVFIPFGNPLRLGSLIGIVFIGLPLSTVFTFALMRGRERLLRRLEDRHLTELGATPVLLHALRTKDLATIEKELRQLRRHPQLGALVTAVKRLE